MVFNVLIKNEKANIIGTGTLSGFQTNNMSLKLIKKFVVDERKIKKSATPTVNNCGLQINEKVNHLLYKSLDICLISVFLMTYKIILLQQSNA